MISYRIISVTVKRRGNDENKSGKPAITEEPWNRYPPAEKKTKIRILDEI
jgi:hypothetical protein